MFVTQGADLDVCTSQRLCVSLANVVSTVEFVFHAVFAVDFVQQKPHPKRHHCVFCIAF